MARVCEIITCLLTVVVIIIMLFGLYLQFKFSAEDQYRDMSLIKKVLELNSYKLANNNNHPCTSCANPYVQTPQTVPLINGMNVKQLQQEQHAQSKIQAQIQNGAKQRSNEITRLQKEPAPILSFAPNTTSMVNTPGITELPSNKAMNYIPPSLPMYQQSGGVPIVNPNAPSMLFVNPNGEPVAPRPVLAQVKDTLTDAKNDVVSKMNEKLQMAS